MSETNTNQGSATAVARQFQSMIALVIMVVAMSLMSDTFFTAENGRNILLQISINVCLSVGMTLVILSGGIDLSVGSVLAIASAVAAGLLKDGVPIEGANVLLEFTVFGACVAGIAVGLALGFFNGLMVTRFRIPPFVATLGMLGIARGLTNLWTNGHPITALGDSFGQIGRGAFLGLPMPVWIAAVVVLVFVIVTKRMTFGRQLYAVGGNERASLLSGLRVDRIKLGVYTLAGGLSAVAGLILASRLDAAQPNAGFTYELNAIAAVVIGGTSLSGGRGSVMGTVLGCLIIGVLNNGLVLLEVSANWQQVVKGLVILAAVALDQMRARKD